MDPKWHIAFLNISITEYAGVTFREYYSSPAAMLEAQLTAAETAERRFGVGRFIRPYLDTPLGTLGSLLGMRVVFPEEDEAPWTDVRSPIITDVAQADAIRIGDVETNAALEWRRRAREHYHAHGYAVGLGGNDGSIVTTACEVSGNSVLVGLAENPDATRRVFDVVFEANRVVARLDAGLRGTSSASGYIGDDFAGLMSPEMFRAHVIPYYEKTYAGKTSRFMHSELLRHEHLRIARDALGITEFHGAGAEKLTLAEMYDVMGHDFWAQLTPQELVELTPARIAERIKVLAGCGAGTVQLYPGRGTPERNMEAAIAAAERWCTGGPRLSIDEEEGD